MKREKNKVKVSMSACVMDTFEGKKMTFVSFSLIYSCTASTGRRFVSFSSFVKVVKVKFF